MKTNHVIHRSGGRILEVIRAEHSTDEGIGWWGLRCNIQWDGSEGVASHLVEPHCFCSTNEEGADEVRTIMAALNVYLQKAGRWHDMKEHSDGRCYSWTPKKAEGWQDIEALIALAAKQEKEAA